MEEIIRAARQRLRPDRAARRNGAGKCLARFQRMEQVRHKGAFHAARPLWPGQNAGQAHRHALDFAAIGEQGDGMFHHRLVRAIDHLGAERRCIIDKAGSGSP
jgi:hypothetical protein